MPILGQNNTKVAASLSNSLQIFNLVVHGLTLFGPQPTVSILQQLLIQSISTITEDILIIKSN